MADIRINALPTTASASSSDDYIALDGTTNGTRKLNAYSPTFGGNLTVNGTASAGTLTDGYITVSAAQINRGAGQPVELQYAGAGGVRMFGATATPITFSSAGNLTVSGTGNGITIAPTAGAANLVINGAAAGSTINFAQSGTNKYTLEYVSASNFWSIGRSGVAYDLVLKSGNLLLGTTTDSGNGKLQLATHTTSAGGIGFGTDQTIYRYSSTVMGLAGVTDLFIQGGNAGLWLGTSAGGYQVGIARSSSGLTFYTGSAGLALTLDSSQRTILAGALRLANTYVATPQVSTGYVTIQDSTGTTYKVLVAT